MAFRPRKIYFLLSEKIMGKIKYILISAALLVLASCTSVNHRVGKVFDLDTDLKLKTHSSFQINPDEKDQASPVFVRLYQLKSPSAFEKADFLELYESDKQVLGESLISKQELDRFLPGTEREDRLVLNKETQYVGLFAEFYRYKDAKAKLIFPVTANNVIRNVVAIEITENEIKLIEK